MSSYPRFGPPSTLLFKLNTVIFFKGGGSNGLSPEFIPTVDRFSDSPFLPEMPELLLQKRQGSFVPFLMGTNRNEGALGLSGNVAKFG